jgi:hypothetical protein
MFNPPLAIKGFGGGGGGLCAIYRVGVIGTTEGGLGTGGRGFSLFLLSEEEGGVYLLLLSEEEGGVYPLLLSEEEDGLYIFLFIFDSRISLSTLTLPGS